ncbi:MAG TPA: endo-1,4-beta-xylanase [Ruminiclostridium sp.]|nr:endo-1,4-beta-xylanase [Ruminiclostridium sp.]
MLESIFINVLNMSLTASITTAIVVLIRLFLHKKMPKMFSFLLWYLVLVRLLVPFSVAFSVSIFNLLPSPGTTVYADSYQKLNVIKFIPNDIGTQKASALGGTKTSNFSGNTLYASNLNSAKKPIQMLLSAVPIIWLLGLASLLVICIALYLKTYNKLKTSIIFKKRDLADDITNRLKLKRKIRICTSDRISTPVVYGVLGPRVILPVSLTQDYGEKNLLHILTHEFYHIKRYDHLSKIIWFSALCIHWFNPLVWLSFILFQKDMEMSCDEKVLAVWEDDIRSEYAYSLINLSASQNMLLNGGLLAFGESSIKSRIKGIVKYKKSGLLKIVICILLSAALGVVLLTNGSVKDSIKFVGNVISVSVPSDFDSYWNQATPENASKLGSVESSRDNMDWHNSDMIYSYAKRKGIPFKFHTLIWGSQEPSWIDSLSTADQKAEVLEWLDKAASKYGGASFVDVVNEPLHTKPSFIEAIGGNGSTGWDWVVWSFEEARKRFKGKLLINDYGIINNPYAAADYVKIINILKQRNLVDGIGIECHQSEMDTVTVKTLTNVLKILSSTGLPIYMSELDMTGDDKTQLLRYREKFPVLYENPDVKGITLWGYIQGQTWKDNTYLITPSGTERPALKWLKEYLGGK